jgi:hypothetical protein
MDPTGQEVLFHREMCQFEKLIPFIDDDEAAQNFK